MTEKRINWHSALLSALKIELSDYQDILNYEAEKVLNIGPRRADILITKDENSRPVHTPIGRQFRRYNLIEYKGPDDTMNEIAFYKALSYLYGFPELYNTVQVLEESSLTLISHSFPRNLWKYINTRPLHPVWENAKNVLAKIIPGLYSINTEILPVQLVVTSQLPKEEYFWLCSLTNRLTDPAPLRLISRACKEHQMEPDYQNYLNTIIRANQTAKGENSIMMCEALDELYADQIAKEREEGKIEGKILGIDSLSALMSRLFQENRISDARRAAEEPAYRDRLLKEYQL